ncbi:Sec1 family protein [Gregarina niphandrodes]|uniref:Sec1 family protein n=1 Tax=Gregarina niphandrodes TaxID=110365 RepID=A0A023B0V2_GRENI|nr:Sec1 family protein [Gregarina niphandrodes]EZG46015.1 Sec1 family protein [Gregarina niphandrodes]|eukprot:XP_011132389.1 Sec1 family protein [Gregarina niphandrodes]
MHGIQPVYESRNRRPTILLTDRSFDYYSPLCHTWTYESLLHDCFGIHLNQVVVNGQKSELSPTTDQFWADHRGSSYPEVAEATAQLLNEFKAKIASVNRTTNPDAGAETMSGLNAAIENAPNVINLKDSLDLHTRVAQELYNVLLKRDLPDFYNLETDMLESGWSQGPYNMKQVRDLLEKGDDDDKQRLILCSHLLLKDRVPPEEINSLCHLLPPPDAGTGRQAGILPALKFLRHHDTMLQMSATNTYESLSNTQQPEVGREPVVPGPGTFGGTAMNVAKGILWQGIKQVMQLKHQPKIVSLVEGLVDQSKKSVIVSQYDRYDPLGVAGDVKQTGVSQAIVFVVGGGSYAEADACAKWAKKTKEVLGEIITANLVFGDIPNVPLKEPGDPAIISHALWTMLQLLAVIVLALYALLLFVWHVSGRTVVREFYKFEKENVQIKSD